MGERKRQRPRMIVFDYGGTILWEPEFTALNGMREVCRYITANPLGLNAEQINAHVRAAYERIMDFKRMGAEVHQQQFMRLAYESIGLEFSVSYDELERIEWDAASPGAMVPHADELMRYLGEKGIRTGVISNIGWSGKTLAERINRLLPDNRFEFVIASSEYGVRKPERLLFEAALRKASLSAEEVWFCGDTPEADIVGAHSAGMYPVLYRGEPMESRTRSLSLDAVKDVDYLTLTDWRELIALLEDM